jgi:hypothetical protein
LFSPPVMACLLVSRYQQIPAGIHKNVSTQSGLSNHHWQDTRSGLDCQIDLRINRRRQAEHHSRDPPLAPPRRGELEDGDDQGRVLQKTAAGRAPFKRPTPGPSKEGRIGRRRRTRSCPTKDGGRPSTIH